MVVEDDCNPDHVDKIVGTDQLGLKISFAEGFIFFSQRDHGGSRRGESSGRVPAALWHP